MKTKVGVYARLRTATLLLELPGKTARMSRLKLCGARYYDGRMHRASTSKAEYLTLKEVASRGDDKSLTQCVHHATILFELFSPERHSLTEQEPGLSFSAYILPSRENSRRTKSISNSLRPTTPSLRKASAQLDITAHRPLQRPALPLGKTEVQISFRIRHQVRIFY